MVFSQFAALLELGEQPKLLIIRHWDWIIGHLLFRQSRLGVPFNESMYLTPEMVSAMLYYGRVYVSEGNGSLKITSLR
jgi:hypothetical protein